MFNPITGKEMSTQKAGKLTSIAIGGFLLTVSNVIKAASKTTYDTTVAFENEAKRKVIKAK